MAILALAELAHRAARAPAGEVGPLRFTAVGRDWDHPAALDLMADELAVFRSLDGIGRAAAITETGAVALATLGLPLPPRTADLAQVRRECGAADPAAPEVYVTPWLIEAVLAAQASSAPAEPHQLELIPGLRPMRRGEGRRGCRRRPAA